ncbi:alkaline phosphatase family protein [Martelella endophytica]|nr:alkaline phosphatase family protein [Martelella endophytica]
MKPNILLITADQWRGDCLGLAGHPTVRTQHIDALAAEGVAFMRHYAGSAPCAPARATLYTGLYQMNHRVARNGTPLDDRFDNIARLARRAGYDPTLFGYTDTTPDPRALSPNDSQLQSYEGVLPGFTVRQLLPEHQKPWLSWLRGRGHAEATDLAIQKPISGNGKGVSNAPPAYSADETETAFLADEFLRWHSEQEGNWFAHVSFIRPHPPYVVPEPYNTMFAPEQNLGFSRAPSRAREAELHPFLAWELETQGGKKKKKFLPGAKGRIADWSETDYAALRAIYFGMIAEVDAQIGRIVAALKKTGAWNNTIIIFTSDHGEMMGDHWMLGKGGFFEGSYHTPLVIRDPKYPKGEGKQVDAFTSAADILPTLAARLGLVPENHVDGASLMPFLRGKKPETWRDAAFYEYDFRDIARAKAEEHFDLPYSLCNLAVVRDHAFKYVHFAGMKPLLFDLTIDPHECTNVADDPKYLPARLAYAEKLLSLRSEHLDQTLAATTVSPDGLIRQ